MTRNMKASTQQDTDEMVAVLKALADPSRLSLVQLLAARAKPHATSDRCGTGPLCVNALVSRLQLTQPAVSQHLRVLRSIGLVRGERRGPFVHYSVDLDKVERALKTLQDRLGMPPSAR
jgi:ArsR family transcriptional regulator, arsenate/arsenite/antimonite-responsive transcriptional repressor